MRRFRPPETFNIAHHFLDQRVEEGHGERVALRTDDGTLTYAQVRARAHHTGRVLADAGVQSEQRVVIALPDGPAYVAALFGTLEIGAVVVMVNPDLGVDDVTWFLAHTGARAVVTAGQSLATFQDAAARTGLPAPVVLDAGRPPLTDAPDPEPLAPHPTHRDDAAIWLFSGGTTGRPKAVLQSHASFANTTELYGKGVLGLQADDVTVSVPKLYFGYATGSNLFFPFSVGASAVLFEERCTAEALFARIARRRPTVLVNVPTMIQRMLALHEQSPQDLSCLRLATSAGEALPPDLHRRWHEAFGVELLDGLGTAEMWHIFLSNRPGDVQPGTLGRPVPGFQIRLCDEDGREVPDGEVGTLRVAGDSRAIGYWRDMEATQRAFHGPWYVSGDMLRRDPEGRFVYCGRSDDMLKVGGKWLAPGEVENCLVRHPAVAEAAVVGVTNEDGLMKPHAFVVRKPAADVTRTELSDFVARELEPYKAPREVVFVDRMPRTHLGKIDRGALSSEAALHPRGEAAP